MNSNFRTRPGMLLAAFSGAVLLACLCVPSAHADSWDKMTLFTFDQPTQVMNTYLDPGTYMFKLANSDRHIVQIFNADRSHLINTIIAIPDYRVNVTGKTQITFWETPPGTAKAVHSWFYPGDNFGQEFPYPTDLRQIAALTPPAIPQPAPPPPAAITAPPAEPIAPPEPQAEAQPAPPEPEQPPVEVAQNTPPPAPAAPETPAPSSSESLPQTASPYPLAGLAGFLAFALYFGLRLHSGLRL